MRDAQQRLHWRALRFMLNTKKNIILYQLQATDGCFCLF